MADKPASEKTEEPTPERLKQARQQGQIPQSQETPTALMFGVLLLLLAALWPSLLQWFTDQARSGLCFQYSGSMNFHSYARIFHVKGVSLLLTLAPFLLAGVCVSIFASLIGSGWSFSPRAVKLDLTKLNPVSGLKNLFSMKNLVRLVMAVLKIAFVLVIVALYLRDKAEVCLSLLGAPPGAFVRTTGGLIFGLLVRLAMAFCLIALIDLVYQRKKWRKDLRMTRQEVKDEHKQHEINPEIKSRIRSVQTEMANKRMLRDVPAADVVVTNPDHVAVGLKYDAARMPAPQVVAKGAELLCQRIKDVARRSDVPVVERPRLARTLYATTEIGQTIPETLFVAVAEVLAMIYKMRTDRKNAS